MDTLTLTVQEQATPSFALRETQAAEAFVLTGTNTDDVLLVQGPTVTGEVNLVGPKGETGPQLKGISIFCSGRPVSSEVVGGGLAPYDFIINPTNSLAKAKVAPTSAVEFEIRNDDTLIGTVNFQALTFEGTVTITNTNVSMGDYVTFHAPINADSTLADIGFIIKE